jgi:hypothetical protein
MQKLCALIEANGNLADGSPLFHADFGNAHATPGAPSETTLATAMSLLRNQRTEGNDKADADPAVILVPTIARGRRAEDREGATHRLHGRVWSPRGT